MFDFIKRKIWGDEKFAKEITSHGNWGNYKAEISVWLKGEEPTLYVTSNKFSYVQSSFMKSRGTISVPLIAQREFFDALREAENFLAAKRYWKAN